MFDLSSHNSNSSEIADNMASLIDDLFIGMVILEILDYKGKKHNKSVIEFAMKEFLNSILPVGIYIENKSK